MLGGFEAGRRGGAEALRVVGFGALRLDAWRFGNLDA